MHVYRLRTLGSTLLLSPSGDPLGGSAGQRRSLALLAILAAAGDAGLSRDKLVGLLWPDADAERARHSLTQALYSTRRALDADDLFSPGQDVRLNSERIATDVGDLQAALVAGDRERAVALYEGPFLEGFFLSGSLAFEQWVASYRDKLESTVAGTLDELAAAAEERGDFRTAVERRRRLAALQPFDAGCAVKLMTALARSGDRAGAVRHARVHATLLRQEFDLEADPVVESLAERLREGVAWASDPPLPAPLSGSDELLDQKVESRTESSLRVPVPLVAEGPVGTWIPVPRVSLARRAVGFLTTVVVLIAGGVWVARGSRRPAPELQVPPVPQRVVVAPFRVTGASTALAYLRDGLVELLSTRLVDDTAARSVDAGAVLGAWRSAGLARTMDVPRDTVVALARRLGAERVVVGSIVGTSARVVISAQVLRVPTGEVGGSATVFGPSDSLTQLVDQLAGALLMSDAGEDERLASYTSSSLSALRAFLAGQAAFRTRNYATAFRGYDAALRRDSTFALAALYRAVASERLYDDRQLRSSVAMAWASRDGLSARDLSHFVAIAGPRYPSPSTGPEQVHAWQQMVDYAPRSAESWSALGTRLVRDGAQAGVIAPHRRAMQVFERALRINPDDIEARSQLAQLAAGLPADSGAASEFGGPGPERLTPFVEWRVANLRGDTAARARTRGPLALGSFADLRAVVRASQFDAAGLDDARWALQALRGRNLRASERASVVLGAHGLALNRGRMDEALAATSRLQRLQPDSHAWLRLRVLDVLYAGANREAGTAAATTLASFVAADPGAAPTTSDSWLADGCVVAQWRLSHGDTAGVSRIVSALRQHKVLRTTPLVSTAPDACAELLDAWLLVVTGHRGARARVLRLDSLVFTGQVAGDAAAYAPILTARLLERVGDLAGALRATQKRAHLSSSPRYLATMWREEGRLAERVDPRVAADAYRRYLAIRDAPDNELTGEVDDVRDRLRRIDDDSGR